MVDGGREDPLLIDSGRGGLVEGDEHEEEDPLQHQQRGKEVGPRSPVAVAAKGKG
jgi:hypothetical protein